MVFIFYDESLLSKGTGSIRKIVILVHVRLKEILINFYFFMFQDYNCRVSSLEVSIFMIIKLTIINLIGN